MYEVHTPDSKPSDGLYGGIQTYVRILPISRKIATNVAYDDQSPLKIYLDLPDSSNFIKNFKFHHEFHYDGVFPMHSNQSDIFDAAAAQPVQSFINGYNSTVFSYGETGSGKTYTMVGGQINYNERGIIPRALSMIYQELKASPNTDFKIYISYMEIYNEQAYDLLDTLVSTRSSSNIEDLQKVTVMEDEDKNIHLKNLSMHLAETEGDALTLLFIGESNRMVSETRLSKQSSRSHVIFTVTLEKINIGTGKVHRSKLSFFDLAGFERVRKSNEAGCVLIEAKFINASLLFLEMVINALNDKCRRDRKHVPYRNCILTSLLRETLSGNCLAVMIATINPKATHTDETLSTLRFAQSVSWIKKSPSEVAAAATARDRKSFLSPQKKHSSVDPLVMQSLRSEIAYLREEVAYLSTYKARFEDIVRQRHHATEGKKHQQHGESKKNRQGQPPGGDDGQRVNENTLIEALSFKKTAKSIFSKEKNKEVSHRTPSSTALYPQKIAQTSTGSRGGGGFQNRLHFKTIIANLVPFSSILILIAIVLYTRREQCAEILRLWSLYLKNILNNVQRSPWSRF